MHQREYPLRLLRFAPAAALLGLSLLGQAGRPCLAETVTLQQGLAGYDGCAATTLWEPKTKTPEGGPDDAVLYLRGTVAYREKYEVEVANDKTGEKKKVEKTKYRESANRVLLKFGLPAALKGRKLARARLAVFVPQARNVRMISEILCRQVTQAWSGEADWENASAGNKWTTPGGALDATTEYKRGRPAGAVDSYAFWEYNGQWFPHKYGFLAAPEGGKWIDFNITPLARKWLARPRSNHGVALEPMTQGDKRFLNSIAIDIPSPAGADKTRRPRLVLELGPLKKPYLVGMTHGLRKYCDYSTRYRFFGPFVERHEMGMARNEFEPFQVVVYPVGEQLKGVTFEWTDLLHSETRARIPKTDIKYNCQEMVKMHPNGKTGDWYFHGKEFWVPDPLSHARPVDLPENLSTPFWFTVRTRPGTRPGTYRGKITVKPQNAPPRELQLKVKVWNYKIPERWNFQTMGQANWGYYWRAYPGISREKRAELKKKHIDFLMDHRFMPTEQYTGNLSPSLGDIPYCVAERGGNTIYLHGNFRLPTWPDERTTEIQKLKRSFEAAKEELLTRAGRAEQLNKLKQRYEADKAALRKKRMSRRARAEELDKLRQRYEADKDKMLRQAGKASQLEELAARHEADKAEELGKLRQRYQVGTARAVEALKGRYDAVIALDRKLRAEGKFDATERLIDMSLVYIGDETSQWDLMRRKSNEIRRACPELMIMIGGSFPRKELDGVIDIYDPQLGGGSKVYSLTEEMVGKIAESKRRGERFFWYDAAGPMLPYPNVQCEEPLIASRVVFWMTWKYGVTGFEYYCYGIWSHNLPDKDGRRWPEKPFTPWGWGNTNGDGMLFYPGPDGAFSSVRFENIRDGIEDWESHFVLRDCVLALKKKGITSGRAKELIDKAEKLLEVPDEIVKDLRTWTWQPELLLSARRDLGQTIDAFSRLVSEAEILAVRRARKQSELARQRAMLDRRAAAARAGEEKRPTGAESE